MQRFPLLQGGATVATFIALAFAPRAAHTLRRDRDPGLRNLDHIIVIYLENRSFDNLYGEFPGADGLAAAAGAPLQADATGTPYSVLPVSASSGLPATLANHPFAIEQYIPANAPTIDL